LRNAWQLSILKISSVDDVPDVGLIQFKRSIGAIAGTAHQFLSVGGITASGAGPMPNISFDDFRTLATRDGLKLHQRIDDPFDVRSSKTDAILSDIISKLPRLAGYDATVADIGPGCGPLAHALIGHCGRQRHQLWLIDSAEMLAHIPDSGYVRKIRGRFPEAFGQLGALVGQADVVTAYSMLHYVFEHDNVWEFLDRALALLAPGGTLLLGDVPSWSKRKRKAVVDGQTFAPLDIRAGEVWPGGLTDAVIFGLMGRAAESGFDAYLLPQPDNLPMASLRVDLLFRRPS
jgi:hypothetical protein